MSVFTLPIKLSDLWKSNVTWHPRTQSPVQWTRLGEKEIWTWKLPGITLLLIRTCVKIGVAASIYQIRLWVSWLRNWWTVGKRTKYRQRLDGFEQFWDSVTSALMSGHYLHVSSHCFQTSQTSNLLSEFCTINGISCFIFLFFLLIVQS